MAWMLFFFRLAVLAHPAHGAAKPCDITLPMPTVCPQPVAPAKPVASRPVKFLIVTKRATAASYDVAVTPCKGDAKPWTNIVLPANGQALVATQMAGCCCAPQSRRLHVRHCGTVGGAAQVELKVVEPRADGGRCVYAAEARLSLGVEKTVALTCDTCPEPMCVKVRATRKAMATCGSFTCMGSITLPPRPAPPPMVCMPMMPVPTWSMPAPMPLAPMRSPAMPHPVACPVASIAPCAYVPPLTATKTVFLVKEAGKSKIEMHTGTFTSKAVRMTYVEGMAGTLQLAAGAKRVHISGTAWKAEADKVELAHDGTVTLHGHCKLACDKLGTGAKLAGEKLSFHVQNGRFLELAK